MSALPRDEDEQLQKPETAHLRDEVGSTHPREDIDGVAVKTPSKKLTTFSEAGRDIGRLAKTSGEPFWDKMDRQFEDILNESKQAFKIKTVINITVVIIGIVLVGNSIVYTWLKGNDGWSLFSGGIGVGALVSLFFYKSQDAISKAVGNLSVIDMVFKSHYRAYESVTDYDYKADHGLPHREIADLKSMLELLESTTKVHVDLIEKMQLVETLPENNDSKKIAATSGASGNTG